MLLCLVYLVIAVVRVLGDYLCSFCYRFRFILFCGLVHRENVVFCKEEGEGGREGNGEWGWTSNYAKMLVSVCNHTPPLGKMVDTFPFARNTFDRTPTSVGLILAHALRQLKCLWKRSARGTLHALAFGITHSLLPPRQPFQQIERPAILSQS